MDFEKLRHGTELIKRGFARMQKGGAIMDVTTLEQARIAEEAGAVAAAALLKAVKTGNVGMEDIILLNIAGGGYMLLKEDFTLYQIEPVATARNPDVPLEDLNI